MSDDGVLLVAHSSWDYFYEAATLCRSIRTVQPAVSVAIASDLDISPEKLAQAGFCELVRADFSAFGGVAFKVQLADMTPFRGRTLFLDSDSICFGDLLPVFEAFRHIPFVTLGRQVETCHWFRDLEFVKRKYGFKTFPFFIGDFYLFDRSPTAHEVFASARRIAEHFDVDGVIPIGNSANEEPCFALAMAQQGLEARPGRGRWIAHLPDPSFIGERIDFSRRLARIRFDSIEQDCAVLHFAAYRTQPIYYRERFRVDSGCGASLLADAWAHVSGHACSFWERGRRRLARRWAPPQSSMSAPSSTNSAV